MAFSAAALAAAFAAGCGGEGGLPRSVTRSPALNRPVPPLEIVDLQGRPASLEQFEGRVVLLNLWATWCIPCQEEMPELEEVHGRFPREKFTVVGISTEGREASSAVASVLDMRGITYPNFIGDGGSLVRTMGLEAGVPQTLLLDAEGVARGYWRGRFHPFEPETEEFIRQVVSGDATS